MLSSMSRRIWLSAHAGQLVVFLSGLFFSVTLFTALGFYIGNLDPDMYGSFLESVPWLILLFGAVLTFIGTLYVRSNQQQSFQLSMMNRALAQKNYELNAEITERERLNQILRQAEEEYRTIVDAVNDVILETDTKGRILFLNQTWERLSGLPVQKTYGQDLFQMLHPDEQDAQRKNFVQLVNGEVPSFRCYTRLRMADGHVRAVDLSMATLPHEEKDTIRIVGTITDVEERRRAEKALGEAEKKYRTIVENVAGGIYQVTPDGTFLSVNPAMARILGYDNAPQLMRTIRNANQELYAIPKDRYRFVREMEQTGEVRNFETLVTTRDGAQKWVNENARIVRDDMNGDILYFEGTMEDITQRKEAEIKLREAKINSDLANRAKSEFLANMSHELRTPLNAIIGFSEIIKDEVLGPVGQRQYWEYAKDIHDSGQRLLKIINEILAISQIEAGDRQLTEGLVKLNRVVSFCLNFVGPKAKAGDLEISDTTAGTLPDLIGEELAIKQILLNLLSNAIKYTPPGGRITVGHEVEKDGRLRLSITDTGIGMSRQEIDKALSAFGQVETAFSRTTSGAGLGLTLVDSLVKLHGGSLEIFSEKGIGTTVTVVFPARRIAETQRKDAEKTEQKNPDKGGAPFTVIAGGKEN